MGKKCKGGKCGLKEHKGAPAHIPEPVNKPVPASAPAPKAAQDQVLPKQLNQAITPATVNPAGNSTERKGYDAPLRNLKKGNYKSDPYKRHAGEHFAKSYLDSYKGALTGAVHGAAAGPEGAAVGAAVEGTLGLLPEAMKAFKNLGIDLQVKKEVRKLNDITKGGQDPEYVKSLLADPAQRARLEKHWAKLNELAPGMLAPGQEYLPAEEQHAMLDKSVKAANDRGSEAVYPGKTAYPGGPEIIPAHGGGGNGGGPNKNGFQNLPLLTAEQSGLQNELIGRLINNPAKFRETNFNDIYADELRRFKTETLPQTLEQAYGRNPYESGSGQEYQLQKAGEGLASRLGAMRAGNEFEQNKARASSEFGQEGNYLQGALKPTFQTTYTPPTYAAPPQSGGNFQDFTQSVLPSLREGGYSAISDLIKNRQQQPQEEYKKDFSQQTANQGPAPLSQQAYQGPYSPEAYGPKGQDLQKFLMQQQEKQNFKTGGRGY